MRISDLVLDDLRRLAGPFGVDDDLRVGEVGDGVERDVAHGVNAAEHQRQRRQQNDELVPQRKIDDAWSMEDFAGVQCVRCSRLEPDVLCARFPRRFCRVGTVLVGTRSMPHFGQSPGWSETTSAWIAIGQV